MAGDSFFAEPVELLCDGLAFLEGDTGGLTIWSTLECSSVSASRNSLSSYLGFSVLGGPVAVAVPTI